MNDGMLETLLNAAVKPHERELAARYAPIICFDEREPFLPLAAGYTIFHSDAPSPSFPRYIGLDHGETHAAFAIEYAIWWDWDIQHLYELEHVWVYVDEAGEVVRCEASWHGGFHVMEHDGMVLLNGDRPVVYSEPGKHAFAPAQEWFTANTNRSDEVTNALAGVGGLHITPLFQGIISPSPLADRLAQGYLVQHAFTPSYTFIKRFSFEARQLVSWPDLFVWIPKRIGWWLDTLRQEAPANRE